jgi:hypothetical protein
VTDRPLPPTSAVAATGAHEDLGTEGSSSPQPSKESRKPNEINSVSELLAYAYSRGGRSIAITPKVRKALASDTPDRSEMAAQITRLAASDPLLAVPPKVLIALERARIGGRLRETLLNLLTQSLRHHPGLASVDLTAAMTAEPPLDHDGLLHSVKEALSRLEPGDLGKASLRPTERRALQDNAVLSVALLVAIKHGWSATTLADCLDTHLWQEDLAAAKIPSERALIVDGTSPMALALVARGWREKLTEQTGKTREAEAEARDAHRRWQEAVSRADAQTLAREQTEKVLAQREEAIASLERALVSEREQRRIDKSHAIDDYETLRAQLVRGLVQQTSLLEDGLHALRNNRLAVTDEYVERVIDSLRHDLQRLRDGIKTDRGT